MEESDRLFCSLIWNGLKEEGIWIIPRSGLCFQKQGDALILLTGENGLNPYQQADYYAVKENFEDAGYKVRKKEF